MERPGVFVTSSHILPKYCPQAPVAAADFWTERCCFSLLAPRRRLLRTGRFLRSAGNVHVIFVSGTHSTRRFGMGTGNFCGLKTALVPNFKFWSKNEAEAPGGCGASASFFDQNLKFLCGKSAVQLGGFLGKFCAINGRKLQNFKFSFVFWLDFGTKIWFWGGGKPLMMDSVFPKNC